MTAAATPARAIGSATISFGLVSIPVKVYTAAASQAVRFNQLHECGGRVRQQLYCPVDDEVIPRSEIVKGYEYAKGQYVRFSADELKAMEAERTNTIDLAEFVPLASVDPIAIEASYYLGPDKGGNKAYALLHGALTRAGTVAVGRYQSRGKDRLVLVRAHHRGLVLHYVYYADEIRAFDTPATPALSERETEMADRLVAQLTVQQFSADQYRDEYRDRVLMAVEQKVAGQEITVAPATPTPHIMDLFEALKASLEDTAPKKPTKKPAKKKPAKKRATKKKGRAA